MCITKVSISAESPLRSAFATVHGGSADVVVVYGPRVVEVVVKGCLVVEVVVYGTGVVVELGPRVVVVLAARVVVVVPVHMVVVLVASSGAHHSQTKRFLLFLLTSFSSHGMVSSDFLL